MLIAALAVGWGADAKLFGKDKRELRSDGFSSGSPRGWQRKEFTRCDAFNPIPFLIGLRTSR